MQGAKQYKPVQAEKKEENPIGFLILSQSVQLLQYLNVSIFNVCHFQTSI